MKLKLIAAAVAIAAAGHASAAVTGVSTGSGSSLLFYAFDDATKTSYIQDLGTTFNSFLPGAVTTDQSWNIAASADWAAYLTSVSGNTANTTWGVIAGIKANAATAANGILSTVRVGDSAAGQSAAFAKGAVGTPLNNVIIGVNGATTTPASGYFSASAAGDNIANNWGHNGAGKLVFRTDNFIGDTATFQYAQLNTPVTYSTYLKTDGITPASFTFNGTSLNYNVAVAVAPVPEPSSYAMLMAGMLVVAGVAAARRRNSSK